MGKRIARTIVGVLCLALGIGFMFGHGGLIQSILGVLIVLSSIGDIARVWRAA